MFIFFFSSRRRHTRYWRDWSSDVCSSDLREAYVRVTKETVTSGGLGPVYAAVEEWIVANGHEVAAPPRETYWADFDAAGPRSEERRVGEESRSRWSPYP